MSGNIIITEQDAESENGNYFLVNLTYQSGEPKNGCQRDTTLGLSIQYSKV